MNFDVFGPFEIPRNKAKILVDTTRLRELTDEVQSSYEGLLSSCGCYVFVMRAGKGYKPWYVGQTKKSFLKETFNAANINKYNIVISGQSGRPMVFFVPIIKNDGNGFRKPSERLKSIDFLEKWLISEAFRKNPNLLNLQHTKYLRDLHVTGVFNSRRGESTLPSKEFGRAIW